MAITAQLDDYMADGFGSWVSFQFPQKTSLIFEIQTAGPLHVL